MTVKFEDVKEMREGEREIRNGVDVCAGNEFLRRRSAYFWFFWFCYEPR